MLNTVLLYEDYQDIQFIEKYPDLAKNLNLVDKDLIKLLELKGMTVSRNAYADIIALNSDIDFNDYHKVTPINIADFENKTDVDFAIDLNVLVNKYDKILYYHNYQSKLHTKLTLLQNKPYVINGDPQDLIFSPIINNVNIYYENNIQPLLIYYGCNLTCNSCPISDTLISNDNILNDVLREGKRLYDIGLKHTKVTHFILTHTANTTFLKHYADFSLLSRKLDVKFIVTITPDLTEIELNQFLILLPYIDILYIELNAIHDTSAYTYTTETIYNFINTISDYLEPETLVIGLISISNDSNSLLLEIIKHTVPIIDCYAPTFVNVETDFSFTKLSNINSNLYKRFKSKLNV
jgi:hypothetical protein